MSLHTEVEGDAAGCRVTASELVRLGEALGNAHRTLVAQARGGDGSIDGLAGAAFRAAARRLAHAAGVRHGQSVGLARGLHALAEGLGSCTAEMARVRHDASAELVVAGSVIRPPVPGPDGTVDGAAQAAWVAACVGVAQVRRREQAAQQAWMDELLRWCPAAWPDGATAPVPIPPVAPVAPSPSYAAPPATCGTDTHGPPPQPPSSSSSDGPPPHLSVHTEHSSQQLSSLPFHPDPLGLLVEPVYTDGADPWGVPVPAEAAPGAGWEPAPEPGWPDIRRPELGRPELRMEAS